MTLQEKIEYFHGKQKEIMDLQVELQKKMEVYKAETKKEFGIADGEPSNVLQIVEMVHKLKSYV